MRATGARNPDCNQSAARAERLWGRAGEAGFINPFGLSMPLWNRSG